jgi:hypothetical protein
LAVLGIKKEFAGLVRANNLVSRPHVNYVWVDAVGAYTAIHAGLAIELVLAFDTALIAVPLLYRSPKTQEALLDEDFRHGA